MVMCPYFIGIILTRIAKYLIVNDKFLRGNKSAKKMWLKSSVLMRQLSDLWFRWSMFLGIW